MNWAGRGWLTDHTKYSSCVILLSWSPSCSSRISRVRDNADISDKPSCSCNINQHYITRLACFPCYCPVQMNLLAHTTSICWHTPLQYVFVVTRMALDFWKLHNGRTHGSFAQLSKDVHVKSDVTLLYADVRVERDAKKMRGRDSHLPCLLLFIVCIMKLLHVNLVFSLV